MNGINKVAHNLAEAQLGLGHEVSIWGITHHPEDRPDDRAYGLRLFRTSKLPFGIDAELKAAIKTLPSNTRIHIHGSFIPVFYRISRLLRKYGIEYIYCPHGSLSPGALQKHSLKKRLYFKLFEASILQHAHSVQFLGKIQYESIDAWVRPRNKVWIPNGQNLEELQFLHQKIERPDHMIISFCGRLATHHKGLDHLLDGFARYRNTGGKGILWLIGDGADRSLLEAQADLLEISPFVQFLGSRYGQEKLNLLSHSDVFIHSSRYEGLPTAVLEAAGLGLPCLLSTATNLGELFESRQAGFHLKEATPQQIATALFQAEQLHTSGQLAFMGNRAKELIRKQFNWESIAEELVEKCYGPWTSN